MSEGRQWVFTCELCDKEEVVFRPVVSQTWIEITGNWHWLCRTCRVGMELTDG